MPNVTVVGSGYVGLSLGVLLAGKNEVTILDIDKKRVDLINRKVSTIQDRDIQRYLQDERLLLFATSDKKKAYEHADFVIVATPTNYDEVNNSFDTESVDSVVKDALECNQSALVVIKSTLPLGHTNFLQQKFATNRVVFSPEFLREGQALEDNLYPSRIIVGSEHAASEDFARLLQDSANKQDIKVLFMDSSEAEAVKLFANTYLAMRVSFFNELDSYALSHDLSAERIIDGVCLDSRIGAGYNNPSFGYGGYCLPKDTKQLLSNFHSTPQSLISAVVSSNDVRKDFVVSKIIKLQPKKVGVYRLVMKEGSDNFRSSAIAGVIERLMTNDIEVFIYEPGLDCPFYQGARVISDFQYFKSAADLVICNRISSELADISHKVFTRDIFNNN